MGLIEFKDYPNTSTPLNAENLNNNFNEVNNIVESGSNANGHYIKFSDGTLIQRKSRTSIPANTDHIEVTFPIPFIDTDYSLTLTGVFSAVPDIIFSMGYFYTDRVRVHQVKTASGDTPSEEGTFSYIAIGRWK